MSGGEVFVQITSGSMRVLVDTTPLSTMPPVRLQIVDKHGSSMSCLLSDKHAMTLSGALRSAAAPERRLVRTILDAEETIDGEHCRHDVPQLATGAHGDPLTEIEGLRVLAQMIGTDRVRALLDELAHP